MKNKKLLLAGIIVIIIIIAIVAILLVVKNKNMNAQTSTNVITNEEVKDEIVENQKPQGKVDIIDITSKTRPYAVVVNNTPVAVKVQTGLNKAYLVYEFPTEGNTSRLMALYKDVEEDLKIGTIRSARHNFIDYCLESNAIFACFGWSHYAEDDMKAGSCDYVQGLYGSPYYRENPENLATEHTAYVNLNGLKEATQNKKINSQVSDSKETVLLNYNAEDVDISSKEGAIKAELINIPYGASFDTKFKYDFENKQYLRIENDSPNLDYITKEQFNTKNIIVQKITYTMCSDNYYWDLKTIGSGDGYFITNGYAVPIKWEKLSRSAKTKYKYLDGKEIEVSDGRTYIELQTTSQKLTIE